MKIIYSVLFVFIMTCSFVLADEVVEVQDFFNEYVSSANSYSCDYFNYYCNNARIIRVVQKEDGTLHSVKIPFERYKKEVKKSSKLARLRKYKNNYFNVKILPFGSDYKIIAMRMPSTSDYKVPAHFIVGKDKNGCWKIKEESMNTKVQKFLNES